MLHEYHDARAPITSFIPHPAAYYEAACARLGHDPLREDADGEALWEVVRNSKKSIGGILMDQTIIAGVGNIFRAEILFKVPPPDGPLVVSAPCGCMLRDEPG